MTHNFFDFVYAAFPRLLSRKKPDTSQKIVDQFQEYFEKKYGINFGTEDGDEGCLVRLPDGGTVRLEPQPLTYVELFDALKHIGETFAGNSAQLNKTSGNGEEATREPDLNSAARKPMQ